MKARIWVILAGLVSSLPATFAANGAESLRQPPPYQLNRADESYTYLSDLASHTDIWDRFKYIPMGRPRSRYLSIGGEARERYEYFSNPNWGARSKDSGYLLQRYFLHGDLHMSDQARLFSQFQSSLENGRSPGPRPTDKDELDIHQLFLDLQAHLDDGSSMTLRSGRQELAYGTQRIVSVREGPNVRQSFDGFRLIYRDPDFQVDVYATRPVETKRYVFDDGTDTAKAFWGSYAALPFPTLPHGNIDLYYMGQYRSRASFDQGTARETRHSLGARLWRTALPVDYNFEALYQWGSFGKGAIRSWTVASDTGYALTSLALRPRIGLRADIASGDEDPNDADLQSFNPLFPKGAYFSEAGLVGPVNFIDVNPCLDLHLTDRLTLVFDWDFFWRESVSDGLYNNAVSPLVTGKDSSARYIGSMPQAQFSWWIDRHLTLVAIYGHFFAGTFLRESGKRNDVDYVTTWMSYKF